MSYVPPTSDPFAANPYQSPIHGGYAPPPPPENQAPRILGILSIVSSSMGLLSVCCCLFMPFPLVGLVLGGIGLSLRPDPPAKTLNLIGLGIGALALVLWIVGMFLGVALQLANPEMRKF